MNDDRKGAARHCQVPIFTRRSSNTQPHPPLPPRVYCRHFGQSVLRQGGGCRLVPHSDRARGAVQFARERLKQLIRATLRSYILCWYVPVVPSVVQHTSTYSYTVPGVNKENYEFCRVDANSCQWLS